MSAGRHQCGGNSTVIMSIRGPVGWDWPLALNEDENSLKSLECPGYHPGNLLPFNPAQPAPLVSVTEGTIILSCAEGWADIQTALATDFLQGSSIGENPVILCFVRKIWRGRIQAKACGCSIAQAQQSLDISESGQVVFEVLGLHQESLRKRCHRIISWSCKKYFIGIFSSLRWPNLFFSYSFDLHLQFLVNPPNLWPSL